MVITREDLDKFFEQKNAITDRLLLVQREARARGLLKMQYPIVDWFHISMNTEEVGMTVGYREVENPADVIAGKDLRDPHSPDWFESFWVPLSVLNDDAALITFLDKLQAAREEKKRLIAIETKEWRRTMYNTLRGEFENDPRE